MSRPLVAQQPVQETVQSAETQGSCVLLQNQNVLFGKASQRGNDVIITRDDSSELQLPRTQVLAWADSLRDLYRYRVDQRESDSLIVHLEDAQWCLRYGLYDLTAKELLRVYRVDPDNGAARRVEQELRRRVAAHRRPKPDVVFASPIATDSAAKDSVEVVSASHEDTNSANEFSPQMIHGFARDVQPILVNRCGRCHHATTESSWTLQLPTRGTRPSARMTRGNLAVTAPYINFDSPLKSELRLRALDGHAGPDNTFGPRDRLALKAIESWLKKAQQPGSALHRAKQAYTESLQPDHIPEVIAATSDESPLPAADDESQPAGRLPQVANPFDPEIFNRRFHR